MSKKYYGSEAHKKAIREWAVRNPDRVREIARNHYHKKKLENPKEFYAKKIWKERRRVSRKNNIPFEISFEYLLSIPSEYCPVFGDALEWGTGSEKTASLDKIIPKLGYVEGNVAWVSFRANNLKRDASLGELQQIVNYLENHTY